MKELAEALAIKYGFYQIQCKNEWTLSYGLSIKDCSKPLKINIYFTKGTVAICDPQSKSQQFRKNVSDNQLEQIFKTYGQVESSDDEECVQEQSEYTNHLPIDNYATNKYKRRMYILYSKYGDICNQCGLSGHWSFECQQHPQYKQMREQVLACHPNANI